MLGDPVHQDPILREAEGLLGVLSAARARLVALAEASLDLDALARVDRLARNVPAADGLPGAEGAWLLHQALVRAPLVGSMGDSLFLLRVLRDSSRGAEDRPRPSPLPVPDPVRSSRPRLRFSADELGFPAPIARAPTVVPAAVPPFPEPAVALEAAPAVVAPEPADDVDLEPLDTERVQLEEPFDEDVSEPDTEVEPLPPEPVLEESEVVIDDLDLPAPEPVEILGMVHPVDLDLPETGPVALERSAPAEPPAPAEPVVAAEPPAALDPPAGAEVADPPTAPTPLLLESEDAEPVRAPTPPVWRSPPVSAMDDLPRVGGAGRPQPRGFGRDLRSEVADQIRSAERKPPHIVARTGRWGEPPAEGTASTPGPAPVPVPAPEAQRQLQVVWSRSPSREEPPDTDDLGDFLEANDQDLDHEGFYDSPTRGEILRRPAVPGEPVPGPVDLDEEILDDAPTALYGMERDPDVAEVVSLARIAVEGNLPQAPHRPMAMAFDTTAELPEAEGDVTDHGTFFVKLAAPPAPPAPPAAASRPADTYDGPRLTAEEEDPFMVGSLTMDPSLFRQLLPRGHEPVDTDRELIQRLENDASAAIRKGDLNLAIRLFTDVLDLAGEEAMPWIARGRCHLDLGDYGSAMSDFLKAQDCAPQEADPLVAMGELCVARKDYRHAIEYFTQALELDERHAMAFCRRGISHFYRKEYKEAVQDLKRASELDAGIPTLSHYVKLATRKLEEGGRV